MNPSNPLGVEILNGEVTRQAGMIAYNLMFGSMIFVVFFMFPLLLLLRPPARAALAHVEAME
jgi:DHA2 family multidrug resistance protein